MICYNKPALSILTSLQKMREKVMEKFYGFQKFAAKTSRYKYS